MRMPNKFKLLAIASTLLVACGGQISNGSSSPATVASPTFSPPPGTVPAGTVVTVSTDTSGASIRVGQTDPPSTLGSTFAVNGAGTWYAQATESGMTDSAVASAAYTILTPGTVATPTFSPPPGAVAAGTLVTVRTTTSGASIHVGQTDPPTAPGSTFAVNAPGTWYAQATESGMTDSAVASAAYTILAPGTVATPTFSPPAGAVTAGTLVTVSSATSGASIDVGQTDPPTALGSTFTVNAAGTWYAQATESGMTNSAVASAAYTILASGMVATPTFSPPPGPVAAGTVVTLTTTTPGATVSWGTTNPPTIQRSTFTVGVPGTWFAQGTASGMTDSAVASASYTISGSSPWLVVASSAKGPRMQLDGANFLGRGADLSDPRSCGACTGVSEASSTAEVMRRMDALQSWGANFVRIPLECYATNPGGSSNWACAGSDPTYVSDIVSIVQHAATYIPPMYVLLSIWDDPTLSSEEWPTAATDTELQIWANALLDQPNVIFAPTNEPDGVGTGSDASGAWTAINSAVAAIRAVEDANGTPHHVVAAQGVGNWARDINYYVTHPITADGGDNIVYEIHAYDPASAFTSCSGDPCPGEWEPQSASIPVIIGEFGPVSGTMTTSDVATLMTDAQTLDVPYLAWIFHMRCDPDLLVDNSNGGCGIGMTLTPTAYGTQLKNQLATPWSP